MSYDARVRIRLEVDTSGAEQQMREVINAMQRLNAAVGNVANTANTVSSASTQTTRSIGAVSGALSSLVKYAMSFFAVQKVADFTFEAAKLGAELDAVRAQFYAMAGGAAYAERYMAQMRAATLYTVSDVDLMHQALKLASMGFADSAETAARFVRIAAMLGDKSKDVESRIADFTALIANRSIRRLDNFGFSVGQIRERMKELAALYPGMNEEQRFLNAVLEQGDQILQRLGGSIENTKTAYDRLAAAAKNRRAEIGEGIADFFAPLADALAARLGAKEQIAGIKEVAREAETWEEYVSGVYAGLKRSGYIRQPDYTRVANVSGIADRYFAKQSEVSSLYELALRGDARFFRAIQETAVGSVRYRMLRDVALEAGYTIDAFNAIKNAEDALTFRVLQDARNISDAYRDVGAAARDVEKKHEEARETIQRLSEHQAIYYKLMTQTGTRAYERALSYEEKRKGILDDIAEAQRKLDDLMRKPQTRAVADEIGALSEKLSEYRSNLSNLEADNKRVWGDMLYSAIEARLSLDGLSAREQDYLRNLALSLGLIDEGTYAAMKNIDLIAAKVESAIQTGASRGIAEAEALMRDFLANPFEAMVKVRFIYDNLPVPEGFDIYRMRGGRGASAIVEEASGGEVNNVVNNITANFYNTPRPDDVVKALMSMSRGRAIAK